jgi:DNA (cytosine-5)-methyltransferase 1
VTQLFFLCYRYVNDELKEVTIVETTDWKATAKNTIKAELARKGVDYETLATKLNEIGVEESYNSINTKINRGTFTFQFFLQCMKAMGVKTVKLED